MNVNYVWHEDPEIDQDHEDSAISKAAQRMLEKYQWFTGADNEIWENWAGGLWSHMRGKKLPNWVKVFLLRTLVKDEPSRDMDELSQ